MTATQPFTETHREIQPCTFLDDGVFATKNGRAGIVLKLRPYDSECMDEAGMKAVAHRWRDSQRAFGSDYLVYQYLIKRKVNRLHGSDSERSKYLASKGMYSYSTHLVPLRDGISVAPLRHAVDAFRSSVAEMVPCVESGKREAYSLFRQLLNYDEAVASTVPLRHDEYIDYYAADSQIDRHRGSLRIGDYWAKVLTMKDTPAADNGPDMLRSLREMDCECIIVTEWRELSQQEADKVTLAKQTHFHRSKFASNFAGAVVDAIGKALGMGKTQEERPEDRQKDGASISMEKEIEDLRADMAKNGTKLGEFAMTVILFSEEKAEVERAAAEAFKAAAGAGFTLYQETDNALAAWFAALPAGRKHQRRSVLLTDRNYADLSMLFAPASGNPINDRLNAECLSVMTTRQKSPIYLNTHYGDVGHMLFSGMIGSGKTFTVNYLLGEAIARYNPRVVIFDISGANRSYFDLTQKSTGSYAEIGLDRNFKINPWCLEPSRTNVHFQYSFVKVLVESRGYRMSGPEENLLYRVVRGCSRLRDVASRLVAMSDNALANSIVPHLERWVEGGQYADVFDNDEDTGTCSRLQVFEFEALEEYPEILEPFLFYALHRATVDLTNSGEYGIFVLDEAWKFLLNETVRQYLFRALKTWRKKRADVWIATQSIDDMAQTNMLRAVAENSGWVVLLPNPRMDREQYKLVFKLNEKELDLVVSMAPKSEGLWKPAVGPSKVVILDAGGKK